MLQIENTSVITLNCKHTAYFVPRTLTNIAQDEGMSGNFLPLRNQPKVTLEVTPSDNDLLMKIGSAKDREAFATLFRKIGPRVKAYMMKIGGDPVASEEITQETFIRVWRKAEQFNPKKSSATTWIFTIARNLRIDRLRKENKPLLDPDDPMFKPDETPTPLQNVEQSALVERVKLSISQLPEDQREVVSLSFLEGLSHQEIADAINIPLGTVKSRLRLSFTKLRHALGDLQ